MVWLELEVFCRVKTLNINRLQSEFKTQLAILWYERVLQNRILNSVFFVFQLVVWLIPVFVVLNNFKRLSIPYLLSLSTTSIFYYRFLLVRDGNWGSIMLKYSIRNSDLGLWLIHSSELGWFLIVLFEWIYHYSHCR